MTGIIDVGGGMKCAYSAGLYDYFLDEGIKFDYYLGVSAGSMNLLSFIAEERGRNIKIYRNSAISADYLSFGNFLHNGAYMNYEKVREDFYSPDGPYAFNYDKFYSSPEPFIISLTEGESGDTVYAGREKMTDVQSLLDIVSASCCLPLASKPIKIGDKFYFDGGLGEPIPFRKAFDDGCDKLVIVMSTSVDKKREKLPGLNILGPSLLKDYKNIADMLEDRHVVYNYLIRCIKEYEKQGRVVIFSPVDIPGAFSLIKDITVIDKLYDNGYRDAKDRINEVKKILY